MIQVSIANMGCGSSMQSIHGVSTKLIYDMDQITESDTSSLGVDISDSE